ncbi:MAG: phosphate--acyl-ACP acyltransferase, partial [Phototrophicales bacterium]
MGEIYARRALGLEKPRIALLSNGEEEGKGNQTIRDAAEMLQALDINFVGNVEPKDIMWGNADVVVADGFIGNIFAKTFEASGTYISNIIRDELRRNVLTMLGALLSQSAFKRVRKRVDT